MTPARLFTLVLLAIALAAPQLRADGLPQALEVALQRPDAAAAAPQPAESLSGEWDTLQEVYSARGHAPIWLADGTPLPRTRILLDRLREAGTEGLNPRDYRAGELAARIAAEPDSPEELARLELRLSRALLHYTHDLRQGRMAPESVYREPDIERQPFAPGRVLQGVADTADVSLYLRQLAPANPMYHRLRRALSEYRAIAERGGWPRAPEGPLVLEQGMRNPAVADLRDYLHATGDLTIREEPSDLFDPALKLALERYQGRHGLTADGVLGPRTRREMALPVEERIRQIVLNMERWRWMPEDLGDRHVLVNLASFDVEVVEYGSVALRMRAVVGKPYRSTPVFSDRISYLEFNPTWTLPPTIMRKDLLPKLRENPDYLGENDMHVYAGWHAEAERLDPRAIDWHAVDPERIPYRFVQQPGPRNALGQVKFMFPNKHHVYLHDTPERQLFDETSRAFSSGCIRVEKPHELAEYLLRGTPGWDAGRVAETMAEGGLTRVRLPEPVPVHLTYSTAWVGEGGTIHFRPDIYARDVRLEQALESFEALSREEASRRE